MSDASNEIRWSPRLPKHKLRRLYELDALGIADEELLEEVGWGLYMRCRDILAIQRALHDREVRCARCDARQAASYIPRLTKDVDEVLRCPVCGWELTWKEFWQSFRHHQLNPGGAVAAFERFVQDWEHARSPQGKMLAIDRAIHAFHYSLQDQPDRPGRAAAVNLIAGRLTDVVAFLDSLAYGAGSAPELRRVHARWRASLRSISWINISDTDDREAAP
jgi:hypothetical protein